MLNLFTSSFKNINIRSNIPYNRKICDKVSFGMKEDIFAKQRNGHPLIDTFDKSTNSIDIRSNGLYPANVLSNLAHNEFVFDGVQCASIEGFLQSLKTPNIELQKEICAKYGGSAKKCTKKLSSWKEDGIVYWQGKEYKRDSKELYKIILKAYKACYEQNEVYKTALNSTTGKRLTHLSGKDDKMDTILTQEEFISILNKIRNT